MSFRLQWKTSRDVLDLLSGSYLEYLQGLLTMGSATLYPKLYFSHNAMTQQTTIITKDVNRSQLWMIQHLKGLSGVSFRPEEIGRLLIQYFVVTQECFRTIAEQWDEEVNGPVRCGKLHSQYFTPGAKSTPMLGHHRAMSMGSSSHFPTSPIAGPSSMAGNNAPPNSPQDTAQRSASVVRRLRLGAAFARVSPRFLPRRFGHAHTLSTP